MTAEARPFGFWTATALVVGGMIGAGLFVLPAQLAPYGAAALYGWGIAIAGAMVIGWVLARLTAAMPHATGVVAICGVALGPLPGVLVGWSYWVSVWAANAVLALTAAQYLGVFRPELTATPLAAVLAGIGLLWLLTGLNLLGTRAAGRFQLATTLFKLLPLVAVIGLLAALAATGGARFHAMPETVSFGRMTPTITLAFYALFGFETASVAAERVIDPARNVVRATLVGVAIAGLVSLVISLGIAFALPASTVAASPAPIALFVETFGGRTAGLAVAASALVAVIGCMNAWTLMQGEVPLGMARAGLLPRWMARTSRRDVPAAMLLLSSLLASVLLLANASRTLGGLMTFMLNLTSAATLWLYVGACAAALRLGIARPAAALGLALAAWTLVGSGAEAVLLSLLLMLTAIPAYLARSPAPVEQPA